MAVLRNDSKCSHTPCMLRFFTVPRLALNPDLFLRQVLLVYKKPVVFGKKIKISQQNKPRVLSPKDFK